MRLRSLAWPSSGAPGAVRERGDQHRRDGQHEQRRDRAGLVGRELLGAVPEPAEDEREAQHEEAVGEDGADEGVPHHDDEPGLEREEADEQFRQVAERRLEHAGRTGAQPHAQLVGRTPTTDARDASATPDTTKTVTLGRTRRAEHERRRGRTTATTMNATVRRPKGEERGDGSHRASWHAGPEPLGGRRRGPAPSHHHPAMSEHPAR